MEQTAKGRGDMQQCTPLPNRLLDELMPELTDTQLRVLLVVLRATEGWKGEGNGRKERDWLSHAQLKARTGRASAAVCAAIEVLVGRGLVTVENQSGRELATANERRRSKLYFRLGPAVSQSGSVLRSPTRPLVPATSETEFRNAKNTKENDTKELIMNTLSFSESENANSKLSGDLAKCKEGRQPRDAGDIPAEAARILKGYGDLYRQTLGVHAKVTDSEVERLHAVLNGKGATDMGRFLPDFFGCRFGYVKRRGYSLDSFLDTFEILRIRSRILTVTSTTPDSPRFDGVAK